MTIQSPKLKRAPARKRSGEQTSVPPRSVILQSSNPEKAWSALALADRIDTRLREIFAAIPGERYDHGFHDGVAFVTGNTVKESAKR